MILIVGRIAFMWESELRSHVFKVLEDLHEFDNPFLCFLHRFLAIGPYSDCSHLPRNRGIERGHPIHGFVPTSDAVCIRKLNINVFNLALQRSSPTFRHGYGAGDGFVEGLQIASFAVTVTDVIIMNSAYTPLVENLKVVVFESLADLQKVAIVPCRKITAYLTSYFS